MSSTKRNIPWRTRVKVRKDSVVRVIWLDAVGDVADEVDTVDENECGAILECVGWLVKRGRKFVVIATERDTEVLRGGWRGLHEIPRALVLKIEELVKGV